MKNVLFLALLCLSACSWFHRTKTPPDPPELVVTGAPVGSVVFVDGVQNGQIAELNGKPQVLNVASGEHVVEIRTGDTVVYREQTFVGAGEKRLVKVLSGTGRD
ncbi:MAG TPA: hypothetical protein VGD63_01790 [Steroidobacteraceae bacterium]